MTEGLVRKKQIRAGLRGSTTRILNQIDTLVAAEETDRVKLAELWLSLEEKLETLLLDSEILDLTEDNLKEEIQQAEGFKDGIYSAMVRMDKLRGTPGPVGAAIGAPCVAAGPTRATSNFRSLAGSCLMEMSPFWDSYDSVIHQNSILTDIDKFNYLRSLLKGTARDAVSGLMLTAANYAQAIEILTK